MEATLSTVIVAIMFVAALNTVGVSRLTQHKTVLVCRGRMFAEMLMAEMLTQSYQNPTEPHTFGLENGEAGTTRAAYNDVDDYDGLSESPPVAKDGSALPNSANWTRTVSVVWVDPLDPTQVKAAESGAKRITVAAAFRNVPQATVVAVRTAY
jgi:MSHA pilin protein MshD